MEQRHSRATSVFHVVSSVAFSAAVALSSADARAAETGGAPPTDPTPRAALQAPPQLKLATVGQPARQPYHLGAHAELDVGILLAMKQGAAFAGGVVWGPFRAGLSYATFLSNPSFGGTPDGFTMRANYIVGFNASYFVGRRTDEGLYVQAMFASTCLAPRDRTHANVVVLSAAEAGMTDSTSSSRGSPTTPPAPTRTSTRSRRASSSATCGRWSRGCTSRRASAPSTT